MLTKFFYSPTNSLNTRKDTANKPVKIEEVKHVRRKFHQRSQSEIEVWVSRQRRRSQVDGEK